MNGNHRAAADRTVRAINAAGTIGLLLLVAEALLWPRELLHSYLYAYVLWLGVPLGCLGLFMLHHLVSGGWGHLIQRMTEAGMRTIPLMGLLVLPILFGMRSLYPWTAGLEPGINVRTAYLQIPFFVVRSVVYFAVWIAVAFLLSSWSVRQDRDGDPAITGRIRLLSAPGLILYVLTMTFASIDWLMSLEPGWSSTVYGFLIVVSQVLSALSVVVISLRFLGDRPPLSGFITERHVHHLGNLILTFVILWAYMAYSQFIIIWSGNLPDENIWYLHRLSPGWSSLGLFVVITHFFIPFALLLFRRVKRSIRGLSLVAGWVLLMRVLDTFWLVAPAFHPGGFHLTVPDVITPLALGAVWMAAYVRQLGSRPLLPLRDPRFVVAAGAAGGEA